mgnify:CR=1 FL=1
MCAALKGVNEIRASPRSWLNLQAAYDLRVAEIANGKRIAREISPAAARSLTGAVQSHVQRTREHRSR